MKKMDLHIPNSTEVSSLLLDSIPDSLVSKMDTLLTFGKYLVIILIVYFVIKIIGEFLQARQAFAISSMSKNVSEINNKLDDLLNNKKKKKK